MDVSRLFGSLLVLPPELLSRIMEVSIHPLQTYIQLLSCSRDIRLRVRGTPHELSFFEGDHDLCRRPTADSIGPCKNLAKLSFRCESTFRPTIYGCGRTEAAYGGWVDEAFGGHDRLAVLECLPTNFEPAIERILSHLPGLVELHLDSQLPISTHLLAAIARSCPSLQVLQSDYENSTEPAELEALAPLAGSLRHLSLPCVRHSPIADSFAAVGTFRLGRCPPASLKPLAAQLTHLTMCLSDTFEEYLPGPWLSRLEQLELHGTFRRCRHNTEPLARLLAANQATLQRLELAFIMLDGAGLGLLMETLGGLSRLTHLSLRCRESSSRDTATGLTDLPPALLDRLEDLAIREDYPSVHRPLHIVSSRLRRVHLNTRVVALSLDCPALAELQLPVITEPHQLAMRCPRLRLIAHLPVWFQGFSAPMPELEGICDGPATDHDLVWLPDLLAGSPRLRQLHVALAPDLLARLWACESCSLVDLHLSLAVVTRPLVLRLPGRLEFLRVSLEGNPNAPPMLLALEEAPGLRLLDVDAKCDIKLRLNCPALATLAVGLAHLGQETREIASLELVGQRMPPLGSLRIEGHLKTASLLLGLLARHGARLFHFHLNLASFSSGDWHQLAAALGVLPRLTRLELCIRDAPAPLSLTCPQLRTLDLTGVGKDHKVRLACPLLEALRGVWDYHVELVLAAPNLGPLRTAPNPTGTTLGPAWPRRGGTALVTPQ
ncbi:hypothetical protein PAPYR_4822 [Paratrimastix pyriformis]|uniref:F-box domain-containing protein n=1 Tax=Paratrimastix pyriformis TaxID=342808 RepID=A0ABQ8UJ94_9EUKA|nr:hypothetical protein PAPYR_4822 [Paratrimastix pyriformis]